MPARFSSAARRPSAPRQRLALGGTALRLAPVLGIVALLCALRAVPAMAAGVADINPASAAQDITDAVMPIEPPAIAGKDGHLAPLRARILPSINPFDGWLAVTLRNPGPAPVERVLVFSYPALARIGIEGAAFAQPRLMEVRAGDGGAVARIAVTRGENRFAMLRVTLAPHASRTLALRIEHGVRGIAVDAWAPAALSRYDMFHLLAIGLFWGILFVGAALLFAMRVLSDGHGLLAGGFFALAALIFEGASFGFVGADWTSALAQFGLNGTGVLRPLALVFVGFFGLKFLRSLFSLHEETPLADVGVRIVQYALLAALPLTLWPGIGPVAARIAAAVALAVAGLAVLNVRRALPDALRLVPPGWAFLTLTGLGSLAVSLFALGTSAAVVELILHGLFVVGVMLLVFSAAVRATMPTSFVEFEPGLAPAYRQSPPPPMTPATPEPGAAAPYQGLWDWHIAEDRLYVSPTVEAMLGLAEGKLGKGEAGWADRVLEVDRSHYRQTLHHYVDLGNSSFIIEFRAHHDDGGYRWLQLRATGLAGETGTAERVIGVVTDITSAKIAEDQLVREASHDALTGVGNRSYLIAHFDWAIDAFRQHPSVDVATAKPIAPALILVGVNRLTTINQELGAAAGDQLLIQTAKRIATAIGSDDVLARVGPTTFAVLLPGRATGAGGEAVAGDADAVMALIGDVASQPVELGSQRVQPSVTSVVARAEDDHSQAREVLAAAEAALVRSRRETPQRSAPGQPRAPVAKTDTPPTAAMPSAERRQGERRAAAEDPLVADLRGAVARGEIKVHFQPVMALADRSVVGFEALLRWQHPERGAIAPDVFIPLAEEHGLIVGLGRYVLSMAALQLARWQTFFPFEKPLWAAVNVSSRQLLGEDFVRDVDEVLSSVKLAPGSLKLEVTERLVFEDEKRVAALLERVASKGVALALDDYGQGHSNLNRLKALPVATVKIDKAFVAAAGDGAQGDTILRSTIAMAHEMKLDVVAEGVETEAQAAALKGFGCDFAQGHLFGSAIPSNEVQRFIALNWNVDAPRAAKA